MQKSQVAKKFLKEWVDILQLHDYVVKMRLHKKLDPDQQSQTNGSHKTMIIDISLDQTLQDIEHSIAHELCHIILDPCYREHYGHINAIYGKKAFLGAMESWNLSENKEIEHLLRILYVAYKKEYPPHKTKADVEIGL